MGKVQRAFLHRVKEKGGRLIEPDWRGVNELYEVECECGYRWRVRPTNVVNNGSWCPRRCSKKTVKFYENMKVAVSDQGGTLLAGEFVSSTAPVAVQCKCGREFTTTYHAIMNSKDFCGRCAKEAKRNEAIQKLQAIANGHGGSLISQNFQSVHKGKVEFQCKVGHHFETTAVSVMNGNWCPSCGKESSRKKRRLDIDTMRAFAEKHGGRCLSESYRKNSQPLHWACKCGTTFTASYSQLMSRKYFCKQCNVQVQKDWRREATPKPSDYPKRPALFRTTVIPFAVELGKRLDIRPIGEVAVEKTDEMDWRCQRCGAELRLSPEAASRQRTRWCGSCAERPMVTRAAREEALAAVFGGSVISRSGDITRWRCNVGHEFDAKFESLRLRENFCLQCAGLEISKDDLVAVALKHRGTLLSEKYTTSAATYRWRCEVGHEFSANVFDAKRDWCPKCSSEKRKAQSIHELAKSHGGKWLDSENGYRGGSAAYRFVDADGVEFTKSLNNAKRAWGPRTRRPRSA